jgi:large subunit ribosomal protein L43
LFLTRHAVNNRDKVISLVGLEETGIAAKVKILLESSGAKMKPLKRAEVFSITPSTRGIWSGLHVDDPYKI